MAKDAAGMNAPANLAQPVASDHWILPCVGLSAPLPVALRFGNAYGRRRGSSALRSYPCRTLFREHAIAPLKEELPMMPFSKRKPAVA